MVLGLPPPVIGGSFLTILTANTYLIGIQLCSTLSNWMWWRFSCWLSKEIQRGFCPGKMETMIMQNYWGKQNALLSM